MIINYGAVETSYCSNNRYYSKKNGTTAYYFDSHNTNHAVLLIGWDDNYSKENFVDPKPSSDGAWIVRNSWGLEWGSSGYFYMSYEQFTNDGRVFIAGEYSDEMYYGYDDLGDVSSFGNGVGIPCYAANVFKARGNEEIKSIGFFTTDNNAEYEIYVFNDLGIDKPLSPFLNGNSLIASGTEPYAGYHTINISETLKIQKGHYFSVVVKMTTPNYGYPVACEEAYDGIFADNAIVNAGESYFSNDGVNWKDGKEMRLFSSSGINACIKAFTILDADTGNTEGIAINNINFPDNSFRSYIKAMFDTNSDSILTPDEIDKTIEINISNSNISSLKGIEFFSKLKYLDCSNNTLTQLGVNNNTVLISLDCSSNRLQALDVSNNINLISLTCSGNYLTKIDVSKNVALTNLYCRNCRLLELDLSQNIALNYLDCSYNELLELDLSKNIALLSLICSNSPDYSNRLLKKLDVSKNIHLTSLSCNGNRLTELNISNNTALTNLKCQGNYLTELDCSNNKVLEKLYCSGGYNWFLRPYRGQLKKLDISENAMLTELYCEYNELEKLDISNNKALSYLNCENNKLTELDVSNNTALRTLYCDGQNPDGLKYTKISDAYTVNLKNYFLDNINKVKSDSVEGYDKYRTKITTNYESSTGIATFTSKPEYVFYQYDTGYDDKYMNVQFYLAKNPDAFSLNVNLPKDGFVSKDYSGSVTIIGNTTENKYTWSMLPEIPGLELIPNSTGNEVTLKGIPIKAGTYNVTLTATDSNDISVSEKYTVIIAPPVIIKFSGMMPTTGTIDQKYNGSLTANGGTSYTWEKISGTLPAGLTLSSTTKAQVVLSGTPTEHFYSQSN